jgi:hypothetical protein
MERTVESRLCSLGLEAFVVWRGVRRSWSDRVKIDHGALSGIEGILAEDPSAWRVVAGVEALQSSIVAELGREQIQPLSQSAV